MVSHSVYKKWFSKYREYKNRLSRINRIWCFVELAVLAVLAAPMTQAAPGDLIGNVTFSQDCASGLGVGITYDSSNLWYSCYSTPTDLYRADPKTGIVSASYSIEGGLGSIAYDTSRNVIWAADAGGSSVPGEIYKIQLDMNKNVVLTTPWFKTGFGDPFGIVDGLGLDTKVNPNQLYWSPDGSTTIYVFDISDNPIIGGTFNRSFSWTGTGCYNSGVAIGGNLLFQGSNGCNHVWVVDKNTLLPAFDFSTKVSSDPNFRDEGLTCDPNTFSPIEVEWSKEAYSPSRAHAFEIPKGTCTFGGGGAQTKIGGKTVDAAGNPLENVNVYLYDGTSYYKGLNFVNDWISNPTTPLPLYIRTTATDSTGDYNFTAISPGFYFVLAVPQTSTGYLPKISDVRNAVKDKDEIINLQLQKNRWLSSLDDVMMGITDNSKNDVNTSSKAAADVYVDGYKDFSDHHISENALWFFVDALDTALSITEPGIGWAKVYLELDQLVLGLDVTIGNEVGEEAIKVQWENMGTGPGGRAELYKYANQVDNLDWMRNFKYTDTVQNALDLGYYQSQIFQDASNSIDNSFTKYNENLAYTKPDPTFSYSEVEQALYQQKNFLGGTDLVDGLVIAPQGDVIPFKTAIVHKNSYYDAKRGREIAGDLGHVSSVVSLAGTGIAISSAWTGAGALVGGAVAGVGTASGLVFAYFETTNLHAQESEWGYTQVYWAKDLDETQKTDQEIVNWLETEIKTPTLQKISGHIADTNIHSFNIFGKELVIANEPEFSPIRWFVANNNDITIKSTGSMNGVNSRILSIDRYGDATSKAPTISELFSINAGETKTTSLPYEGDFRLSDSLEPHILYTLLWMGGKIEDLKTDPYYIVPAAGIPGISIASKTMSIPEIDLLTKQPVKSNFYAYTTASSHGSITLEDWVSLLGNYTKIIDSNIDPTNASTQVQYTTNVSITNVTFLMVSVPGSHLNLHAYDTQGRHVGYNYVTAGDEIQIPNATYTGNATNPEIIMIPNASGNKYTINVNAIQFTTSSPIPVQVYAIETPVRPAILGVSPVEYNITTTPGEIHNISIQVAEVGKQVKIQGVQIFSENLTDVKGNIIPEPTTNINNFDIDPGKQVDVQLSLNVSINAKTGSTYTGNVSIVTSNAGQINVTLHISVVPQPSGVPVPATSTAGIVIIIGTLMAAALIALRRQREG